VSVHQRHAATLTYDLALTRKQVTAKSHGHRTLAGIGRWDYLITPSIILIVYGVAAEVISIARFYPCALPLIISVLI